MKIRIGLKGGGVMKEDWKIRIGPNRRGNDEDYKGPNKVVKMKIRIGSNM